MSNQERNQTEQYQAKSEENINTKDFLIGALIGGMVGAATALFLAPKSGKELRNEINEQATAIKGKTGQFRETAVAKGTELAVVAKEKTNAITQTVSKQSSGLVNKVKSLKVNEEKDETVDESVSEIENVEESSTVTPENEVQLKLEETQRAFDETEEKIHQ